VQLVSRLVPHTVVGGPGQGFEGAAAILGAAFERSRETGEASEPSAPVGIGPAN